MPKEENLRDEALLSENLGAQVIKTETKNESILAKRAVLKFANFQPCIQRGKKVTWSCWRESDPSVQGYGNSQQEAHKDLLEVEKATNGGKIIGS